MPSKVDVLIDSIGRLREDIGSFRAEISNLKHDRDRADRVADETHAALGKLRDGTQASFSELRRQMTEQFSSLECQLANHAQAVEKMQPQITALQFTRARLVTLASIGFTALTGLAWLVETIGRWAIDRVLNVKFGS